MDKVIYQLDGTEEDTTRILREHFGLKEGQTFQDLPDYPEDDEFQED